MSMKVTSYLLSDKARKTVRQVALNKGVKQYEMLEKIIASSPISKKIYASLK